MQKKTLMLYLGIILFSIFLVIFLIHQILKRYPEVSSSSEEVAGKESRISTEKASHLQPQLGDDSEGLESPLPPKEPLLD